MSKNDPVTIYNALQQAIDEAQKHCNSIPSSPTLIDSIPYEQWSTWDESNVKALVSDDMDQ